MFEAPVRSSDRYFVVFARSRGAGAARLGLAVAKKRVRRANRRNRLKRLIRESFRENQDRLAGLDLVVVAHAPADREPGSNLLASLRKHWRKHSTGAANECGPR